LTGIKLLTEISNGKLDGGNLKSNEIKLIPNNIKAGRYLGDTQTAGLV
jgi:RNA 3'-terminal phosphate cyclase